MVDDLVERAADRRQRGELLDHLVAPANGLAALDRIAIFVVDGPRIDVALGVRIFLEQLRREGVHQVPADIFARRDVDMQVGPFLGRDLGKAPFHQRFAGRDDLHDRRMTVGEVLLDRADQRRRHHRGDQMAEEALLGALEGRARRRLGVAVQRAGLAGDVGRLERGGQVVVDDLERVGIGIVDADLLVGQRVLEQVVFDAVIGERARRIEAERLEIAGEHLHRGDTAVLDRRDELGAVGERKILAAPDAETLRIGQVLDRGRAGRRDIDDAGVGQRVLQAQARPALLRRSDVAALAFAAGGVGHGVRLVEDDDAIKVLARAQSMIWAIRGLLALALLRAQGRVGGEEDAFGKADRRALPIAGERLDEEFFLAECRPVALGVFQQLVRLGDPDRAAAALQPVVEDDAGDLPALAAAGPVAQKPSATEADGVLGIFGRGRDDVAGLVHRPGAGEMAGMRLAGIDDAFELGVGQQAVVDDRIRQKRSIGRLRRRDRGHRGRLHERRRMGLGARRCGSTGARRARRSCR